jgi:acetyl/propionyl-CoA carboxylase alpha subunit
MVTGVDLVRAQLVVASGGILPWNQDSLTQRGHAIECRVYAEDPDRGFLPQAGPLLMYREPRGPGVRVDAGVVEGGEVTVYYDPMLAKLIVLGETREAAIDRAVTALRQFVVLGVRTNVPYLLAILRHSEFAAGNVHTGFLDAERHALQSATARGIPQAALAAAAFRDVTDVPRPSSGNPRVAPALDPFDTLDGWGR